MSLQLVFAPALSRPDLLAAPVAAALRDLPGSDSWSEIEVAEIDPTLADTAAFCERYGVSPAESANCVVIAARRGGETSYAACMVAAIMQAAYVVSWPRLAAMTTQFADSSSDTL